MPWALVGGGLGGALLLLGVLFFCGWRRYWWCRERPPPSYAPLVDLRTNDVGRQARNDETAPRNGRNGPSLAEASKVDAS